MNCRTDQCTQGRKPCPTPSECSGELNLRRVMDQQIGRDISEPQRDRVVTQYNDWADDDSPVPGATALMAALSGLFGYGFLFFVVGLIVWTAYKAWPILVAML